MKPDENNPLHIETIARYLNGEMDKFERVEFEKQINSSEENKILIEQMKKDWILLGTHRENKIPDTRKAWDKLHTRLSDEKLIPVQTVISERRIGYYLIRAAAVAIILIVTGAIIYSGMNRTKPKAEMVNLKTSTETNTTVKTLGDGSIIYLAQNSLFSFPENFKQNSRNVELKGEAFFDIMPDPDKPFIIETDEAFIQVLGTAFNVKTSNGSGFELIVDRGKVKVTLKKDPQHFKFVVAGEKITSVRNSLIKSKRTAADAISWFKKRMQFKDESLKNIINVLNLNFNTIFVIADKEVGNRRLTVTFNNESAEKMTELICLTLNLKSETKDGSIILLENKAGPAGN
jgi:ferric-dicitrate binding protein FerR (iron transport regulator)